MTSSLRVFLLLVGLLPCVTGFSPLLHPRLPTRTAPTRTAGAIATSSPLWTSRRQEDDSKDESRKISWHHRFDTLRTAGIPDARIAGPLGRIKNIKKLHNPITYLALSLLAGFRWDWCFRNPYYWFAVAFCVKWYRARYVFKIPVWDRQPNWNNIITSKEQEKDLKAFTCKKCGSTIFIAKTREFFFEGNTGIGGLGCFTCGAKGKENFVMDRERIVEDVADTDDYFEYERPLDFVTAAERRKVLKEAQGDEDKANDMLLERQGVDSSSAAIDVESSPTTDEDVETAAPPAEVDEASPDDTMDFEEPVAEVKPKKKKKKKKKGSKPEKKTFAPPPPMDDDDLFDALDMD